jgi:hypothetical protein
MLYGKSVCRGCIYSFCESGNIWTCSFCNSDRDSTTAEQKVLEIRRRVASNDPLQFICWLIVIMVEKEVCSRIMQRQWNYTLGQQSLVLVRRRITWLAFITKGVFEEGQVPP